MHTAVDISPSDNSLLQHIWQNAMEEIKTLKPL